MRRGDIVSVAARTVFGTKPRPAVILQADAFATLRTFTLIGLTSQVDDSLDMRIEIAPSATNGLKIVSFAMIEAVTTVRDEELGEVIGHLDPQDMVRVERATLLFLGFQR